MFFFWLLSYPKERSVIIFLAHKALQDFLVIASQILLRTSLRSPRLCGSPVTSLYRTNKDHTTQ